MFLGLFVLDSTALLQIAWMALTGAFGTRTQVGATVALAASVFLVVLAFTPRAETGRAPPRRPARAPAMMKAPVPKAPVPKAPVPKAPNPKGPRPKAPGSGPVRPGKPAAAAPKPAPRPKPPAGPAKRPARAKPPP